MILSQLRLDPLNRDAMRLVADIYKLHCGVMSGFAGYADRPRVLFRIEPEMRANLIQILVQSPQRMQLSLSTTDS